MTVARNLAHVAPVLIGAALAVAIFLWLHETHTNKDDQ